MLYLSCLLESKNAFTSAPCKKQCSAAMRRVGYNAVPAQKPVNVAMYAAGGAVAGAVVGAGAMCLSLSLVCFFLLNCSTWFCENLCVLCTRRSEDLEFKLEYIAAIESIQDIYIYTCKKIGGWNGIGIWNILCFGAGLRDLFRPLFVHIIEYRLKLFSHLSPLAPCHLFPKKSNPCFLAFLHFKSCLKTQAFHRIFCRVFWLGCIFVVGTCFGLSGRIFQKRSRYAYNNMYSNDWEVHRRRRFGDFRSQSFCVVTAPGERNGAFMACEQCYRLYGHLTTLGSKREIWSGSDFAKGLDKCHHERIQSDSALYISHQSSMIINNQ